MSDQDHIAADRRLAILRVVAGAPDGRVNVDILAAALDDLGHRVGGATVLADLAWLEGRALLRLDRLVDLVLARATAAGFDIADGRETVAGVRPRRGGD